MNHQERNIMPPSSNMARAPKDRPVWMMPSRTAGQHSYPVTPSVNESVHSRYKAFDIGVAMARALITSDADARPKHFRNLFSECLFVFMVMMSTASTTFLQGVIVINTATIGRDLIMTPAQITWISAAIGYDPRMFFKSFTDIS
jgi:hypothetical protein